MIGVENDSPSALTTPKPVSSKYQDQRNERQAGGRGQPEDLQRRQPACAGLQNVTGGGQGLLRKHGLGIPARRVGREHAVGKGPRAVDEGLLLVA